MESPAEQVLSRCAVAESSMLLVLGSFSKRVTFADQQRRALNLVWAAFESGLLVKEMRVAVLGAGLAGLTASLAAHQLGCKVTLIEERETTMPLQRGCVTRFVHPNIYDWPAPHSLQARTSLPLLNWSAGYAHQVVDQIDSYWADHSEGIEQLFGYSVRSVQERSGTLWVDAQGTDRLNRGFDLVILSLGFGIERTLLGVPLRSYWSSDDLHQHRLGHRDPVRVLVSGCGDGGLVDALRLSIRNFQHSRIVSELLSDPRLRPVIERLVHIDAHAAAHPDPNARSSYLYQEYDQLPVPDGLITELHARLRRDTEVFINGRGSKPFDLNASILNRFLVFLLLKYGRLNYLPGEIGSEVRWSASEDPETQPGTMEVSFQRQGTANSPRTFNQKFDIVVVRHGPVSPVPGIVSDDSVAALRERNAAPADPTRLPLWPDGFFHGGGTVRVRPRWGLRERKVVKVAILLNGSGAYSNDAMISFSRHAHEMLSERGIMFDYRHANGIPSADADEENMRIVEELMGRFGDTSPDYLVTIGSGVSRFVSSQLRGGLPHIYISVTDAVMSGIIGANELESRPHNICGVSFPDLTRQRVEFLESVMRKNGLTRLGYVYDPKVQVDEEMWQRIEAMKGAQPMGVDIVPLPVSSPDVSAVQHGCDALFGWLFVHLNLGRLLATSDVPLFGGSIEDVRNGSVAAIGPDDSELGFIGAADILYPSATLGIPLSQLRIPFAHNELVAVNERAATAHGLVLPMEVMEFALRFN